MRMSRAGYGKPGRAQPPAICLTRHGVSSASARRSQTGSGLAIRHNRRHRTVAHLIQGRYQGILVERDAYLLELLSA